MKKLTALVGAALLLGGWYHGQLPSSSPTIGSVSLSSTSVSSGVSGATVGTATANMTTGSFSGGSWSLSNSGGCAGSGTNNGSFAINSSTGVLTTTTALSVGSYNICILATLAGATNSPFPAPKTIMAATTVATNISCGSSTAYAVFTLSPGSVVCAISVQPSGWSGTLSLSQTGVDAGSFSLSSTTLPSNLITNTTLSTSNPSGDLTHLTISASP